MGYTGDVKCVERDTPRKNWLVSRNYLSGDDIAIGLNIVAVNIKPLEDEYDFKEAAFKGIAKGIQYSAAKDYKLESPSSIKDIDIFLDGQHSYLFREGRSTEKIYRRVLNDMFTERSVEKAVEENFLGNYKLMVNAIRKKESIDHPVTIDKENEYELNLEYFLDNFEHEIDRKVLNHVTRVNKVKSFIRDVEKERIEGRKIANILSMSDERLEKLKNFLWRS